MSDPGQNIRVLEIKVIDDNIDGQLFKGNEKAIFDDREKIKYDSGYGKFEPTVDQEKFIQFFIEQLRFLVDKDILASDTVLSDDQKKKQASDILTELVAFLGSYLYDVLFTKDIEKLLDRAMNDKPELLRIQLEFISLNKSFDYGNWPWEYLYQPRTSTRIGGFLAKQTNLMLVRRLTLSGETPDMKTSKPKVLLIISQPRNYDVQCVDLLNTLKVLKDGDRIDLTILEKDHDPKKPQQNLIYDNVWKTITGNTFDIIHFVGHGQCTRDGAQLALVDSKGEADWTSAADIAEIFEHTKQRPKLVFLQACESALPDTYRGVSGVAQALAEKNIPAVIAMQYKIMNSIANNFACEFYDKLATGLPIDLAVLAGRGAIIKDARKEDFQYHAFGLPVLYLRSYDSIFEKVLPGPPLLPPDNGVLDAQMSSGVGQCDNPEKGYCPAPSVPSREKRCYVCGAELYCRFCHQPLDHPGGNFCIKCGQRLTVSSEAGNAQKEDTSVNGEGKQKETSSTSPGKYVPMYGKGMRG